MENVGRVCAEKCRFSSQINGKQVDTTNGFFLKKFVDTRRRYARDCENNTKMYLTLAAVTSPSEFPRIFTQFSRNSRFSYNRTQRYTLGESSGARSSSHDVRARPAETIRNTIIIKTVLIIIISVITAYRSRGVFLLYVYLVAAHTDREDRPNNNDANERRLKVFEAVSRTAAAAAATGEQRE